MTTRYTDGGATVTLDGGLDAFVRRMVTAAETETIRVLEAGAEDVATAARAKWYGSEGVTQDTGASGKIEVITTFDAGRNEVRVSVGSTDTKTIKGKPRAVYIHRPGALSTVLVEITVEEYNRAKAAGGASAALVIHPRKNDPKRGIVAGKRYRWEPNPKAADGAFLLTSLVKVPARAKIKLMGATLARAIAERGRRWPTK